MQVTDKPSGYMIPVGKSDDERLKALGAIYNDTSIKLLQNCNIKNPKILDVGCGNGYLTCLFAKTLSDSNIVGCDISHDQIEVAISAAKEQDIKNISWEICDALKLGDLEKKYPELFDIVHVRFVLTHLPDPIAAIDPMLQMLKRGGILIVEEIGAKKKFIEPIPKCIQAWQKMVQFQHQLQQSHKDTVERVVSHLTNSGKVLCQTNLANIMVDGQEKKSLFRLGVEHALSILEKMGKMELIRSFGYDNSSTWLEEVKNFENDQSATLVIENYESIIAVKL